MPGTVEDRRARERSLDRKNLGIALIGDDGVRFVVILTSGSGIAWSPDGTTLATPCDDLKTYLWDPATGTRKETLEGSTSIIMNAAFHPPFPYNFISLANVLLDGSLELPPLQPIPYLDSTRALMRP